jgi:hypothetical protein
MEMCHEITAAAETSTHVLEVTLAPPNASFAHGAGAQEFTGRLRARQLLVLLRDLHHSCEVRLKPNTRAEDA